MKCFFSWILTSIGVHRLFPVSSFCLVLTDFILFIPLLSILWMQFLYNFNFDTTQIHQYRQRQISRYFRNLKLRHVKLFTWKFDMQAAYMMHHIMPCPHILNPNGTFYLARNKKWNLLFPLCIIEQFLNESNMVIKCSKILITE